MYVLNSASTSTLMFGVLAMVFAVLRLTWPLQISKLVKMVASLKFWMPVCAILLGAYLILLVYLGTYRGFIDHIEPNVTSVAWMAARGQPIYHGLESTERYALLYGPMSYLPYMWALQLFGPHILSAKLVVVLAHLALLALLWRSYRTLLNWQQATFATAMVITFLLAGEPYPIDARSDVIMILTAAIGLASVISPTPWRAGLLLAMGTGLCIGVKVTGGLYFVPLFILLYRRHGARTTAATLAGAAAVVCLPFTLRAVSFTNYLLWLRQGSHHPLRLPEFTRTIKALVMLSVPFAALIWRFYEKDSYGFFAYLRREKLFLLSLLFCVGLVTVLASKAGAGDHHYLPFYPLLGYLCCDIYRRPETTKDIRWTSIGATACVLCLLWLVVRVESRLAVDWSIAGPNVFRGRALANSVTNDLQEIMREHPGVKIEMGYGDKLGPTNNLTRLRTVLVFAGNPLTIDQAGLEDMRLSGVKMPESTIAYLDSCGTQIWLIPRGEHPFIVPSFYNDPNTSTIFDIFGDTFRQAFFDRYQRKTSSKYFDLWTCKKPRS